jgi:hypothetical protein
MANLGASLYSADIRGTGLLCSDAARQRAVVQWEEQYKELTAARVDLSVARVPETCANVQRAAQYMEPNVVLVPRRHANVRSAAQYNLADGRVNVVPNAGRGQTEPHEDGQLRCAAGPRRPYAPTMDRPRMGANTTR